MRIELTSKISELEKVNQEKIKQKKENMRLKQEITTLEDHSKTLRQHIKTKDDLSQNMKKNTLKLRDVANKSTQAEDTTVEQSESNIDKKLNAFTLNTMNAISNVVDEKLQQWKISLTR